MKDPNAPKAADMEHRIAMCHQSDVVIENGMMQLQRTSVVWTWARIKTYYGVPAFIGQQGYAIIDPASRATHAITIRGGHDLDISAMAWVYEKRLKSPPRWYKILGFTDPVGWIHMTARLVEKSDQVVPPHDSILSAQPTPADL
jgi:hypothetical protein